MVNIWVSRNSDNLRNNPDQEQQLAIVAGKVGMNLSDLLCVGVDQHKRMRGHHINSVNRKTVASLSLDGDNHQLYRKYGVHQIKSWIKKLKDKGEYESTRAACNKKPHEELSVADRYAIDF